MEEYEVPIPETKKGTADSITEASLRLELTDLLLGRPGGVPTGISPEGSTLEQGAILERIEAALETYRSYFYPPEHR